MKHQKLQTTPEISRRMGRVRLKRSRPEVVLAKALWHKGYRYRLNDRSLPGSPDIVLFKQQIALFVDGEFWHGKDFARLQNGNGRNKEFWIAKISENMRRDRRNDVLLKQKGWVPLHFWSQEVLEHPQVCVEIIEDFIRDDWHAGWNEDWSSFIPEQENAQEGAEAPCLPPETVFENPETEPGDSCGKAAAAQKNTEELDRLETK